MLEEAVKNDKSNPAEVALSLLQFIQNEMPAGGSGAENRFIRMYIPINDRIFGPILLPDSGNDGKDATTATTTTTTNNNSNIINKMNHKYKHAAGGWMSAKAPCRSSSSSSNSSSTSNGTTIGGSSSTPSMRSRTVSVSSTGVRSSSSSLEKDPVARLLGTATGSTTTTNARTTNNNKEDFQPTLIEAISKESTNRPSVTFPFPFFAFPEHLQQAWLALLDASWAGGHYQMAPPVDKCSAQTARLLTNLLHKPPLEQTDLLKLKQNKARRQSSAATPLMQLSPRGFPASPSLTTTTTTSSRLNNTTGTPSRGGVDTTMQKAAETYVYFGMLEYYLFLFIRYPLAVPVPTTTSTTAAGVNIHYHRRGGSSSSGHRSETHGEIMYYFLFRRYLAHFVPHNDRRLEYDNSTRDESELFLHILICLWLESTGRCQTTKSAVQRLCRGDTTGLNLNASYDLVQVKYDPPFYQVQKCLLALVKHLVLDPLVQVPLDDGAPNYVLPKAMALLQEPFFNYVRASFRTASIHIPESPFYTALEAWLIWLEPWNVKEAKPSAQLATRRIMGSAGMSAATRTKRLLKAIRHDTPSLYHAQWEAYVAANLHLYTVPLAIFLRRTRELDFSAPYFLRSLKTVNRVFRVFCPAVNLLLNRLLAGEAPQYIPLVNRHVQALGPFAPPNADTLTLSSCQEDMKIVLEEVYLQHAKKLRDLDIFALCEAKINSFFGSGVIKGEEKTLHKLVEQARNMVDLPADYEMSLSPSGASRLKTSATTAADQSSLAYSKDGILTDESFQKVFLGEAKCDPADAVYNGDAMKGRRLGTDEVRVLVQAFVGLSDYVHSQTGYKINFRYFANWRHLVEAFLALCVGGLLLWVVRFVFTR